MFVCAVILKCQKPGINCTVPVVVSPLHRGHVVSFMCKPRASKTLLTHRCTLCSTRATCVCVRVLFQHDHGQQNMAPRTYTVTAVSCWPLPVTRHHCHCRLPPAFARPAERGVLAGLGFHPDRIGERGRTHLAVGRCHRGLQGIARRHGRPPGRGDVGRPQTGEIFFLSD